MVEFRLTVLDEVASTNEEVKRALEAGEPEGLAVRARVQTGGYGRQGRAWASPEGGMYQSLALRPRVSAAQLPSLSLLVGVAVRRALCFLVPADCADDIKLKWPNDVLCDAGKLCGISLETHAGGVCVGIGVNVLPPREALEVGGKNRPAYVADFAPEALVDAETPEGRHAFLDLVGDAILEGLAPLYEEWLSAGIAPFLDEINACESLHGSEVSMVDAAGAPLARGRALRVDEHGCLVLRCDDGSERAVASGEAHITRC